MTGLDHYPMGLNAFEMVPPKATADTAKAPAKRGPKSKAQPVREVMQRLATRVNLYSDSGRFTNNDKSAAIRRGGI